MRVEVKIQPDIRESNAVIYVPKMTPELMAAVEMLERADEKTPLFVKSGDKIFIIEPEQTDIIRTEGSEIKLYTATGREYIVTKPLRDIQEQLGASFIRISKSTIININRIDHLSPSFNRTMYVVMKNGVGDYISRKHLADFKKRIGLLEVSV